MQIPNDFRCFYNTINVIMKIIALISSYIVLCLRLLSPGGSRAVAAENIILRQQQITFGLLSSMISVKQLTRIAIILKPGTLLKFHKALVSRKYSPLFSNKPGPDEKIIHLIIEMKQRNPSYGYRRIAMQISNTFHLKIDWLMVVMDKFTPRIIGFAGNKGSVTG